MSGPEHDLEHDYDWVIVGSGFGGSVAALRLAQKGYRVAVVECGRRFEDHEFAERASQLRRVMWLPKLGMKGILRMTKFKDVVILSGSGVGGGSLVYAQTLYRAAPQFYRDWERVSGESADLDEFYAEAERMLGVTPNPRRTPADRLMAEISVDMGAGDTFRPAPVGVFFGMPGKTVPDPYFDGEGPDRAGCTNCGGCMLGCRHNAKNTLPKNYLWLAERLGVEIIPERLVTSIVPVGAEDGSDGYRITSERSGAWVRNDRSGLTAGGVVLAAGALGTNRLLLAGKQSGELPRLSERVGHVVRTNSESMTAVTFPDDQGWGRSVAITGSIFPTATDHVETTTYGTGGLLFKFMFTLLTPNGTRLSRPLKMVGQILRHPLRFLKMLNPKDWSNRTLLLPVMQAVDESMRFVTKRRLLGGSKMATKVTPGTEIKTFIPLANEVAERLAAKTGGIAQSTLPEILLGVPGTAHLLGGAIVATDPTRGVVDMHHRAFGYHNLLVVDGAAVPANCGVNPSLTITAMAERAMAAVPAADHRTTHLQRKAAG